MLQRLRHVDDNLSAMAASAHQLSEYARVTTSPERMLELDETIREIRAAAIHHQEATDAVVVAVKVGLQVTAIVLLSWLAVDLVKIWRNR